MHNYRAWNLPTYIIYRAKKVGQILAKFLALPFKKGSSWKLTSGRRVSEEEKEKTALETKQLIN